MFKLLQPKSNLSPSSAAYNGLDELDQSGIEKSPDMSGQQHALAHWRGVNGLSQRELGDRVGVTEITVSRWERRTRHPNNKRTKELMDLTGLPLGAIRPDLASLNAPQNPALDDTAARDAASCGRPNHEISELPDAAPMIGGVAAIDSDTSRSEPQGNERLVGADALAIKDSDHASEQTDNSSSEAA